MRHAASRASCGGDKSRGFAFDSGGFAWQGSRRFRDDVRKVATLANPELGAKQICPNCQSKFYDLGRRPAVCPKCATQFDPEEALKSRRVRARSTQPDYEDAEETPAKPAVEPDGFEDEADETPEVDEGVPEPLETDDDVDPAEGGAAPPADDLGVDFAEEEELEEEDADVPFLEDEDEEDNFEDEIEGLPGEEPD
jgi:uncharacterized protein (TIGR02300 family)